MIARRNGGGFCAVKSCDLFWLEFCKYTDKTLAKIRKTPQIRYFILNRLCYLSKFKG